MRVAKYIGVARKTIKAMLHKAADLDKEQGEILVAYEKRCESEGRLNAMVNLSRWEAGRTDSARRFSTRTRCCSIVRT